ncbi:MAG: BTAD domain-containing putative transcriptional regulator [Acidimicrobiales bacterium]
MELRVLGALSAHENGQALDLGGRQQRLVLALLATRPDQVVSFDRLLDEMWGEDPPTSARKAVQGYVSNLRKTLGADKIRTETTGYRLVTDELTIDAITFETSMRTTRETADGSTRRQLIAHALESWAGRPYEDLEDVDALSAETARLGELRLVASEEITELAIEQGDAASVLPDIGRLARSNPFRETTCALHMRALYATGRQREALQTFEDLRHRLAEEIGVEPSQALKDLEAQLLTQTVADPSADSSRRAPLTRNPYRGLRPYDERSGDSFFGRDALVRRLIEHVDRAAAIRLTVVTGASGAGKSSVVRAGLVPRMHDDGRSTRTTVLTPGSAWLGPSDHQPSDIVVLDQLEAALSSDEDAAQTCAAIAAAAHDRDGPRIVATLRADYLDVVLGNPHLGQLIEAALVIVPPMTDDELVEAIVKPAASVGVGISPALTDLLVTDMRERAAGLPLLQYALTESFERSAGGELTINDYRHVGGLGGALGRRADALLAPLNATKRALVREALLGLVTLGADGVPILRTEHLDDIDDERRAILELFGEHRMVTFDRGDTPTVAISHETLVREWGQLARWIEEARSDLTAQRRLADSSTAWDEEGRPDELLFGPSLLARYDDGPQPWTTQLDREFLAASRAEVGLSQQRRRRTRRVIGAALGAAALIAIAFALVAQNDRRDADEQRQLADQRALVSEALLQGQGDPQLGLLLAAEAYAAEPGHPSLRPLLSVLGRFPAEPVVIDDFTHGTDGVAGGIFGRSVSGTVRTVFSCTTDVAPGVFLSAARDSGTVALVDAATGIGRVIETPTTACTVSVDDQRASGVTDDIRSVGVLVSVVFDLQTGAIQAESAEINQPVWLPGGRILGFARTTEIGRIDAGDQSESSELVFADPTLSEFTKTGVSATAIYPDRTGDFIVLSDQAREFSAVVHRYILDARDLSVVHDLGVVERTPNRVIWSPDGSLFGDVSESDRLRVWRVDSGELIADTPLGFNTSQGAWLAFSPTNAHVALVMRTGEVTIRPIDEPSQLTVQVRRETGGESLGATAASFIDDDTIAVLLNDGSVEVTNLQSSALAKSEVSPSADLQFRSTGWAERDGRVLGLTDDVALVELGDPTRSSAHLLGGGTRPRIAGTSPSTESNLLRVWAADLDSTVESDSFMTPSTFEPGSVRVLEVDLESLEPIGEQVTFELLPGTRLVVGLRDRIAAQNAAGTIFQYGFDGERLSSRVDLPFLASAISQSPSSSRAIVAGSGGLAVVDLDSGEVFEELSTSAGAPVAMLSDDLAVITRLGGDVELWSVGQLESIGPLLPIEKRGRNESVHVTDSGDVWYHTSDLSQHITTSTDELLRAACRLALRPLTEAEWQRHVSTERSFDPTC